jgi:hypothetical protein
MYRPLESLPLKDELLSRAPQKLAFSALDEVAAQIGREAQVCLGFLASLDHMWETACSLR